MWQADIDKKKFDALDDNASDISDDEYFDARSHFSDDENPQASPEIQIHSLEDILGRDAPQIIQSAPPTKSPVMPSRSFDQETGVVKVRQGDSPVPQVYQSDAVVTVVAKRRGPAIRKQGWGFW